MQQYNLPDGVKSRSLPIADLNMFILEAGQASSPLIILLHGFPELAISWRKVIPPLVQYGYRVVAPDLRGFGRTISSARSEEVVQYDDDLHPYRVMNYVKDVVALALALGHRTVAAVVGHDLGSPVAALCALIRPDMFKSLVLMSAPLSGPPPLPFDIDKNGPDQLSQHTPLTIKADKFLASLDPPRKHYMTYYTTRQANDDMLHAPQGLHAFLRAYFHMKSADWPSNDPHPLSPADPSQLAMLPHYYIMPLKLTMPEVVQPHIPSEEDVLKNKWLLDSELAIYTAEYSRTGFQGGLNWYRSLLDPRLSQDLAVFAGKKVEVPAMFLSGEKDWGVFQNPGAFDKMKLEACTRMEEEDVVLIEGAGHWVQQEQPEQVVNNIKRFLEKYKTM
ncbi:hypothetical protein AcW1_009407 [Taiwanofungus camphoratus]|nr:hypothetical protein AcW1_009407 [Antrodia cinnamomea]